MLFYKLSGKITSLACLVVFLLAGLPGYSQMRRVSNARLSADSLPPIIISFSPESGPIGTTININGNHFNSTTTGNIVYFGDTRAVVSFSSATQLTCVVPAGASYQPISVLHMGNGLSGRSAKPFAVTFADSSYFTPHSFSNRYTIDLRSSAFPLFSLTKDMDGDGKTDLINAASDSLAVFTNHSSINSFSFGSRLNLMKTVSALTGKFAIDDLDGDGKPDLVAVNNNTTVSVIKNNSLPGSMLFATKLDVPCAAGSFDVVMDDIDNDGRKDIIVGTFNAATALSVIKNNSAPGSISFGTAINISSDAYTQGITSGDIDGDGKIDLATINDDGNGGTSVSYFRNTSNPGTISFAVHEDIQLQGDPQRGHSIFLADLDNDNKPDLVITNGDNYYIVLKNTSSSGSISFTDMISASTIDVAQGTVIANLSGGVQPDLAVASWLRPSFTLFKNIATHASIDFAAPLTSGAGSLCVQSGDIDGDGKTDIISTNTNAGTISIYQNAVGTPISINACEGQYTNIASDISGAGYQWQRDSGTGFINITNNANLTGTNTSALAFTNIPSAWNGFRYRCLVDGRFSSVFTLAVNNKPFVSIAADKTTICYGVPVTFTATTTNGGLYPSYQWQVNGVNKGTDSSVFICDTLKNADSVQVIIGIPGCAMPLKDSSNLIHIIVNGDVTTVNIKATDTVICAGKNVSFTAIVAYAGSNPTYQWKVNNINTGVNSNVFSSDSLPNNAIIKLAVTNDPVCGSPVQITSNAIIMHVSTLTTPFDSIYISSPADSSFCSGTEISFSSSLRYAGTSPTYQWQVNGVNVNANSPVYKNAGLKNADQVRMILSSHGSCNTKDTAVSNTITVSVKPILVPAINITGNTIVNTGATSTISTTILNGGTAAAYNWQDSTALHSWQNITGGTNPTIAYAPVTSGDALHCILTSNARCVSAVKTTSNVLIFNATTVTAINSIPAENLGIHYFPNPVVAVFYIQDLKIADQWETISITSLNGKEELLSGNIRGLTSTALNLGKLASGYYTAILKRKKGPVVYIKFIKQ